jgi:hypothetical protein
LRVFERIKSKYFGGFVFSPPSAVPQLSSNEFVPLNDSEFLSVAGTMGVSQEWRGKIFVSDIPEKIVIRIKSEVLKSKIFLLFLNGVLREVTTRNKDGLFEFEINESGAIEISLRSPVRACQKCRPDFSDIQISIRKI